MYKARLHYLLQFKKLALDSSMVKYGSENKITAQNFGFSYVYLTFSCVLKFERQLSAGNTNSLLFFLMDMSKMSQSQ